MSTRPIAISPPTVACPTTCSRMGSSSTNDNLETELFLSLRKACLPAIYGTCLQDKANNSDISRILSFDDTGSLTTAMPLPAAVIPIQPAPKNVMTWKRWRICRPAQCQRTLQRNRRRLPCLCGTHQPHQHTIADRTSAKPPCGAAFEYPGTSTVAPQNQASPAASTRAVAPNYASILAATAAMASRNI